MRGRRLGLPVEATDQPAAAAARRWLEQHDRWLLVLDNAPALDGVRSSLPQGGGGHVLVTSRNPNWVGAARPLPVRPLERPDAIAFLLRRTGQTDAAAATELAEALPGAARTHGRRASDCCRTLWRQRRQRRRWERSLRRPGDCCTP